MSVISPVARKRNADLKEKIRKMGIAYYEIAEYLGVSENTVGRWMRSRLTDQEKEHILGVAKKIRAEYEELEKDG